MKQFALYIACLLLCSWNATAENTMTLKECIETGLTNNLSLNNADIDIKKSHTGLSQSRSRLLPVITGSFQVTDYLKKPVNVTSGTLLGNDFPDNPTWQTVQSMQYNANAAIQLSMPLFNKSIFAGIEAAKIIKDLQQLSYNKASEEITMQISKAYYMAQATQALVTIFDENISRMEELCKITEALFNEGVILETDATRATINLENLKAQRCQYSAIHDQYINLLRFLMNLEPEQELNVTRINDTIYTPDTLHGISTSLPELELLSKQLELIRSNIKIEKAGYLPGISLVGQLGAIGYQEDFGHFFHTKDATQNWFGNCFIGISVKIPLFDANSRRLKIKQHKLDAVKAEQTLQLTRKNLTKDFDNSMLKFNYNMEQYHTYKKSYTLALDVYNITEDKYKEGIASMTELLQDEMRMRNAQSACIQALCQCKMSHLELLKLSGNLNQLTQ